MSLDLLWKKVHDLHDTTFPNHPLAPILGAGCEVNPKVMFVFINPTIANCSAKKDWQGPRFPFIGTKAVWRIFHRAGLFDEELMQRIESCKEWSYELTNDVLFFLKKNSLYVTNIVKWAGLNADLPKAQLTRLFLPLLKEEIALVRPARIVTFGLIPFEFLMEEKIRLSEYYDTVQKTGVLVSYDLRVHDVSARLIPVYFPVGRGNPKRAVELLRMLSVSKFT